MKYAVRLLPAALLLVVSCGGTPSDPGTGMVPGDTGNGVVTPPDDTGSGGQDAGTTMDQDTGTTMDQDTGTTMDMDAGGSDACVAEGAENTDTVCNDGIDNDCNGLTDCDDPGCHGPGVTVCGTTPPVMDSGTMGGRTDSGTTGGRTDTGAGRRDSGRTTRDSGGTVPGCMPTVPRRGENTDALCSNGVDDDCNGYTDCMDYACSRSATVTVCGAGGRDAGSTGRDAGGTRRDAGRGVDTGSTGSCVPTVGRGGENTDALCSNGVDDDCNGYTDCVDYACSRSRTVTVCRDGSVPPG